MFQGKNHALNTTQADQSSLSIGTKKPGELKA